MEGGTLWLRTGPFGGIEVPVASIVAVRRVAAEVPGFGLRRSAEEEATVVCSVGGMSSLLLELDPPLAVALRKGAPVEASRIRFAADAPAAAVKELRDAGRDGVKRGRGFGVNALVGGWLRGHLSGGAPPRRRKCCLTVGSEC
ncbi:hypothetical protein GCM10027589_30670 [Actinocorallia lasiicapitis]